MEPVASTQKQTSMNPNAGSGRSFDPVLKIVALEGFIDLSMLRARTILEPVEAGGTAGTTTGAATAGCSHSWPRWSFRLTGNLLWLRSSLFGINDPFGLFNSLGHSLSLSDFLSFFDVQEILCVCNASLDR